MTNPYSELGPDDYQAAALAALPTGPAWPRHTEGFLARFWGAVGDLLAKFGNDTALVVDQELNPRTTDGLLADWEAEYGLPDPCVPGFQSPEQRRDALNSRITEEGSLSRQKYIDLAAAAGFPITITEFRPTTCLGTCVDPILGPEWRFAWRVNAPEVTVSVLTCVGNCISPLRSWGNDPLECLISGRNRPSRFVLFSYGS
jgi:uncharacterized protein YmfQ (DUF2313 family)